ncbi:putative late blight resistance protein homolog R1B-8 [Solanum stenotomum]|uniref:putative late blight resistance protein homolog R1B-8 n=1 Tax=Solanum stenotomum TaxID=172797 RepID=UPI0020D12D59|nr:putative late blight resistance protein homolog R1B-8 [Solanum stenotomum]
MAATYAALTSVLGTIDKLLRSNLLVGLEEIHKQQLESLDKMFGTLQKSLIGKCDGGEPIITKDLQRRIKDVALDAEDEVESLMKQLIIEPDDDEQVLECCRTNLDKVSQQAIQVTDSVNEELSIKQKMNCPEAESSASPRLDASIRENISLIMEGYNKERERMVPRLTRGSGSNKLEVVSVVGMPGIAERVQQGLKGEKYLIVVDDIWSKDAWDRISHWFPDCGNKSRILLTSRDREVGEYAASNPKESLVMRPLTQDESRNLFYRRAFGKNYTIRGSDDEFEKVGEEVVTNCKGLPLMITAVAGILSSKSKLDEWMEVAQSVSSLVNDDDYKQCLKVVALSYNNLPSLIKACFLHFGLFPKAHVISVKKLIRLWIAEGLVNLKGVEEFEQVAARVLHDLIGKSLVIVEKRSLDGQIKTCRIHDLFHDLCLKEAESENLLYVLGSDLTTHLDRNFRKGPRWMSIQSDPYLCYSSWQTYAPIKIRSLYIYYRNFNKFLFHFKPLRVLDVEDSLITSKITGELVCLKYLAVWTSATCVELPISNLWNLQTLIFSKGSLICFPHIVVALPKDIWQMSQLRHLYAVGISLSSPGDKVLGNLQSVSGLSPSCCTKEIFEGIKKVKKLAIRGRMEEYPTDLKWIDNLKYLQDLESLSIADKEMAYCMYKRVFFSLTNKTRVFSLTSPDSFPQKLKKLKLSYTTLPWEYMSIISKLPELEVLQLKKYAFHGREWKTTDQIGFLKLRFLLLDNLFLEKWETTTGSHDHFPSLERVIITHCIFLKEIPQAFVDSKKLELIELHKCEPSLVAFAEKIQEKHEDLGRNKLKVTAFDSVVMFSSLSFFPFHYYDLLHLMSRRLFRNNLSTSTSVVGGMVEFSLEETGDFQLINHIRSCLPSLYRIVVFA